MQKKRSADFVRALQFDWLTPLYDLLVSVTLPARRFRSRLVEAAGLVPGQRVLDVGCETGTLAIALKKAEPAARIFGLDSDRKILAIAARKAKIRNLLIHFDQGLASALPYADASFDRVVSTLVFHHLTKDAKRAGLVEIRRVLDVSGELHLLDFGRPSNRIMAAVSWLVGLLDTGHAIRDNFHGVLPSLMREAGLSEVEELTSLDRVFGTLRLHRAAKSSI